MSGGGGGLVVAVVVPSLVVVVRLQSIRRGRGVEELLVGDDASGVR